MCWDNSYARDFKKVISAASVVVCSFRRNEQIYFWKRGTIQYKQVPRTGKSRGVGPIHHHLPSLHWVKSWVRAWSGKVSLWDRNLQVSTHLDLGHSNKNVSSITRYIMTKNIEHVYKGKVKIYGF